MNKDRDKKTEAAAAKKAIDAFGSAAALGRKIGVERVTVGLWKKNGVPVSRCKAVELLTGVTRAELQPDHFG